MNTENLAEKIALDFPNLSTIIGFSADYSPAKVGSIFTPIISKIKDGSVVFNDENLVLSTDEFTYDFGNNVKFAFDFDSLVVELERLAKYLLSPKLIQLLSCFDASHHEDLLRLLSIYDEQCISILGKDVCLDSGNHEVKFSLTEDYMNIFEALGYRIQNSGKETRLELNPIPTHSY